MKSHQVKKKTWTEINILFASHTIACIQIPHSKTDQPQTTLQPQRPQVIDAYTSLEMDRLGGSSVIYMLLYSTPPLSSLHPHAPVLLRPLSKHPPTSSYPTPTQKGVGYEVTRQTLQDRNFRAGTSDRKLRVTGT
jgi:hypothetical protein